jgi:hypothetical protein
LCDVEGPTFSLDNRLTDGGKVVSLTRRQPFTPPPGRFLVHVSVKRLSRPQGHSAPGKIRSIEKIHLIGNQTRDLPVCSIVPQPTTLPCAPASCVGP